MRNDPVETVEYKGHVIKVYMDDDSSNPRTEWDHAGHMVCWHKRYNLGDKNPFSTPQLWLYSLIEDSEVAQAWNNNMISDKQFMEEGFPKAEKTHIILPLYLYDHSGLTISTSQSRFRVCDSVGWDWGQVGWIYISHNEIWKEWGKLTKKVKEKAEKRLISEVDEYDMFLTGQVYGYVIEEDEDDDTHIDSCWGYFGDHDKSGLLEDARSVIDSHVEEHSDNPEPDCIGAVLW